MERDLMTPQASPEPADCHMDMTMTSGGSEALASPDTPPSVMLLGEPSELSVAVSPDMCHSTHPPYHHHMMPTSPYMPPHPGMHGGGPPFPPPHHNGAGGGPMTPMGMPPYGPPQQSMRSFQNAQMWHQSHFHDSGVQSMSQSSAPSMLSMSSIHPGSQISAVSSMPDPYRDDLTEEQRMRLNSIPSAAKEALPQLLPLLEDEEEVAACALKTLVIITKQDCNERRYEEPVINDITVIHAVYKTWRTHRHNKFIVKNALTGLFHISQRRSGLELIIKMLHPDFLKDLLDAISVQDMACYKYALMLLHTLITERNIGRDVVKFVRDQKALTYVADCLEEGYEKLLHIVVGIVTHLCDRSTEQQTYFVSLNGPAKLKKILAEKRYPPLLERTARLLSKLAHNVPEKLVDAGVLEVLHLHLDHGSQKLVHDLLRCIQVLSDVAAKQSVKNVTPILAKAMQLMGSSDLNVKLMCTSILLNLLANNAPNKEFVYRNHVTHALRGVLEQTEMLMHNPQLHQPNDGSTIEEIQENALIVLRSLCMNHKYDADVQREIMMPLLSDFYLRKLVQMRPKLLSKTLLVLCKTAVQEQNMVAFRDAHVQLGHDVTTFVHKVIHILHVAATKYREGVTSVEDVKVTDIMHSCMVVLQKLVSRGDRVLLKRIVDCLQQDPMLSEDGAAMLLPVFALYINDERLLSVTVTLLCELSVIPTMARLFAEDGFCEAKLNEIAGKDGAISEYATRCLTWIKRGGDANLSLDPPPPMPGGFPPPMEPTRIPHPLPGGYPPHGPQAGPPPDAPVPYRMPPQRPQYPHPSQHGSAVQKQRLPPQMPAQHQPPFYPNGCGGPQPPHPRMSHYPSPTTSSAVSTGTVTPAEMNPYPPQQQVPHGAMMGYPLPPPPAYPGPPQPPAYPHPPGGMPPQQAQMNWMGQQGQGNAEEQMFMSGVEDYPFANVFCSPTNSSSPAAKERAGTPQRQPNQSSHSDLSIDTQHFSQAVNLDQWKST